MRIFGKRVSQLEPDDIDRLVKNKIKETKSLDYKRDFKLENNDEKREFLFDIASMYNTDGGLIIFGIEEQKDKKQQNTGVPKSIEDIHIENEDKLFQMIEDTVRTNTEPSICNLELKLLIVDEKQVLIIGIPKGLYFPCMVTFNSTNKFYKRKNTGKYAVDVYELNQMFMQNQVLKESIDKFRQNRFNAVSLKKVFHNLDVTTFLLAHIFPFSFINERIIDISAIENNDDIVKAMKPLLAASSTKSIYNIDGFATYSYGLSDDCLSTSYNITSYDQLFRNGVYEIYSSRIIEPHGDKPHLPAENLLLVIEHLKEALNVLNELEIEAPFYVNLSFYGLLNGKIKKGNTLSKYSFTSNEILLPAVLVQSYDTDLQNALNPVLNILFQAVGDNQSPI